MLTTSPNTKDVCRRRIARWLYQQRPMAIMHDSYKELYRKFLVKHPELQALVSKATFKKHAPFYLRKVKREGCLCKSCESYAMGNKPFKKFIRNFAS